MIEKNAHVVGLRGELRRVGETGLSNSRGQEARRHAEDCDGGGCDETAGDVCGHCGSPLDQFAG
jgi:hypothetical protein